MKKYLSALLLLNCATVYADFAAIEAFQKSIIDEEITGSNVAMVFQDGETIYHHVQNSAKSGDRDITSDTIFPIFSMSKPVTIVAMMILHEKGLVDLEDPVSKYLPELADLKCKGEEGIYKCVNDLKIVHLMSHRSGYQYYISTHYIPSTIKYDNLEDFVDDVGKLPLEFEPGTQYQYGINQALLGCVVEAVTGQSFYQFLKENIFDPLGMENTKFFVTEAERKDRFQPAFINSGHLKGYKDNLSRFTFREGNRAFFGGEGLVSTMEDYSKFCRMLLDGGIYGGKQIISPDSIERITQKTSEGYPLEAKAEPELSGFFRGFSLFVLEDPEADGVNASKGIFGWSGATNTHFWIDPEKNLFGLFMSRARDFSWDLQKRFRKAVYSSVE